MMPTLPARARSTTNVTRRIASTSDRALQDNIKALGQSRKELEGLDKTLRRVLKLPSDKTRGALAKILHALTPQSLYPHLPERVVKLVAEEYDVLELIERLMRSNLDNIQSALRNLAFTAQEKRMQLDELAGDLAKAKEEGWDAQRIQAYLADKAGIQIYEEVSDLLNREFNILPADEREARKEELLAQLQSNIVIGGTLMTTMGKVCGAGLQIFHRGVGRYFDYMNVYRPLTVIRDSAESMTEMNTSMFAAKDALVATFQTSVEAIKASIEATTIVNRYSIASSDMKGLLEKGGKEIDEKLKLLRASTQRLTPHAGDGVAGMAPPEAEATAPQQ